DTMTKHLLFIHGKDGSSQGFKVQFLRRLYPDLLAPDFPGDFWQRMARLEQVSGDSPGWTMIGSSMGGLMAAVFACQHPGQVDRLVLLAPALAFIDLAQTPLPPSDTPAVIYHGQQDEMVPLERTRQVAEQLFPNLQFHVVNATHDLNPLMDAIDWPALLGAPRPGLPGDQP
ncbi:MAG TPA: alpha/beta fold hydrolase, partial [Anaerolineae bacterium]|nr:alpha/beta fold hydrolase [Anaerolineae bacterium]HNU05672.1 alpha/beta fold hydrolase [Anaerolineae bacterium]